MKTTMSSHSLHSQCSNTFEEQLVYIKHCSGEPHPAFCKKIIQTIKLRPGLWISIMDFTPSAPLTLKYEKKQSTIDFGYLLSGTMRRQIQSRSTERMELQNRAGMAGITFIPESQGNPGNSVQPKYTDSACSYHSRTLALPPERRVEHSPLII